MRFTGTFVIVVALFVTVLVISNIIAVKPITILPIAWFGDPAVVLPASIIIFPISYIVGDVLTEVYGYRIARGVIWLGFVANVLVVLALWLATIIPGAFFWSQESQDSYTFVLGQVPGIVIASFIAYLVGEFSNSTVLALLKYKMKGRLLFVRTIGSTVVGQGFDSFIFIFIAFGVFGDWSAHRAIWRGPGPVDYQNSLRGGGYPLDLPGGESPEASGRHRRYQRAPGVEPTGHIRLIHHAQKPSLLNGGRAGWG